MINVHWRSTNEGATYTVTAQGKKGLFQCSSTGETCRMGGLPCGSMFSVTAVAETQAGKSLPSYSVPLETGVWLHWLGESLGIALRHGFYLICPMNDENTALGVFSKSPSLRGGKKTTNFWYFTMFYNHIFRSLLSCPTFTSKEQNTDPGESILRIYILPRYSHTANKKPKELFSYSCLWLSPFNFFL